MNLTENSKVLPMQMSLPGAGSLTALCLILSGCATSQSNSEPVATAKKAISSYSEETAETNQCGITTSTNSENTIMVLRASGGIEARCLLGSKVSEDASICLKESEKITLVTTPNARSLEGPGCFYVANGNKDAETSARLSNFIHDRENAGARTGAVRAAPQAMNARRTVDLGEVKVIRGSTSALKRYKLKATILTGKKICLNAQESLTVLRKKGGVLNLRGPGCNVFRRSGKVENVPGVSGGS